MEATLRKVTLHASLSSLRAGRFPLRAFLIIIGLVCASLTLSAVYGYFMLSRLRSQYMQNRAREIAIAIDGQVRGPGRRNNPAFWQAAMSENLSNYRETLRFIALIDRDGRALASAGAPSGYRPTAARGFQILNGHRVFVEEFPLSSPREAPAGVHPFIAGWRLRLGLDASAADFIRTQAMILLLVTGIGVATLIWLSYYLLRTLAWFLELKAREESERHLRVLGSMAATLAHEIRNPLGAVKGLTQLAQEALPPDHRTQDLMTTVVGEAERLEKLVSDLLSFARPRKPRLGEFDLASLAAEVRDLLQPRAAEKDVTISLEADVAPMRIRSDPDGLRQVLLNVVLNAVEAASSGTVVVVRTGSRARTRSVYLEVEDRGPGLQGRDPEELFQPFVTSKTQGTGLGLAISRRIVESLGGTIRLSDLPAGGARCTIRLGSPALV